MLRPGMGRSGRRVVVWSPAQDILGTLQVDAGILRSWQARSSADRCCGLPSRRAQCCAWPRPPCSSARGGNRWGRRSCTSTGASDEMLPRRLHEIAEGLGTRRLAKTRILHPQSSQMYVQYATKTPFCASRRFLSTLLHCSRSRDLNFCAKSATSHSPVSIHCQRAHADRLGLVHHHRAARPHQAWSPVTVTVRTWETEKARNWESK